MTREEILKAACGGEIVTTKTVSVGRTMFSSAMPEEE